MCIHVHDDIFRFVIDILIVRDNLLNDQLPSLFMKMLMCVI